MVNLEHFGRRGFLTVFLSIGLAEYHSKSRGKSNVPKYIFSYLKSSSCTDGARQQEGASLHLQVRTFMTYGSLTPKNCNKWSYK